MDSAGGVEDTDPGAFDLEATAEAAGDIGVVEDTDPGAFDLADTAEVVGGSGVVEDIDPGAFDLADTAEVVGGLGLLRILTLGHLTLRILLRLLGGLGLLRIVDRCVLKKSLLTLGGVILNLLTAIVEERLGVGRSCIRSRGIGVYCIGQRTLTRHLLHIDRINLLLRRHIRRWSLRGSLGRY